MMSNITVACQAYFDGEKFIQNALLSINQGIIASVDKIPQNSTISNQLKGLLTPGFIDVQVNGGNDYLFNQTPNVEALIQIGKAHYQFGTTGWLPTLVTDKLQVMQAGADAVAAAILSGVPGILGIHFEGPHLSAEKRGVHQADLMRDISEQEMALFTRSDLGKVVVTLAPEKVSSESIRELVSQGVIVCIGHSNATCEQTQSALAAGASGFTHLFNAMSALNSRAPGVVGAALADRESWCGIILDGVHVHPVSAQVALNAKRKIMLVTDAMPLVGSTRTEFELYGRPVKRVGDGLLDQDGNLAGSNLDMASAVRNCQSLLACSVERALNMASINPATFLGLNSLIGSLQVGKRANMVLLDDDGMVQATWIDGVQVF